jgi:hypothetical protein
MAGKRDQPPNGRYVAEEHPSIKGLVCVYWVPQGRHRDPRPLLTLGPGAVPLLAEALAEWELEHQVTPAPRQAPSSSRGQLRAVNDDGVI